MRINPINYYQTNNSYDKISCQTYELKKCQSVKRNLNFYGKYTSTKILGGLFGTIATVGAAGFAIFSSGGLAAIPFVIGYGALGAGSGAIVGYQIDKDTEKFEKELDKVANNLHVQA